MNFLRWNHILCAVALAINLLPAKAAQIAYSVADFSSVQGQKNWYYGYFEKGLPSGPGYTPDDFELLDRYVPNVDPNLSRWPRTPPPGESYGGYPWIRPTGSHPAGIGPAPQQEIIWSVLRYRSPVSARASRIQSCRAVSQRAAQTLKWVEGKLGLLTIALDHLTMGRAALYEAILEDSSLDPCHSSLEHAVNGLRRAGQQDYLPRSLLTRAWLRSLTGPESAQADLDEAWEIAERGPMPLFLRTSTFTAPGSLEG